MITKLWELRQKQSLPLSEKISMSKRRIRQWYEHWKGNVYISFSGGKDSTVLLHLVRSIYPDIPAVFVDTGLEYPEIKEFVKTFDNVVILRPKLSFKQVLDKYGYPVVSKRVARQISTLQNPTKRNSATRKLYLTGIKRDGTKSTQFEIPKKWKYLVNAPFKISDKCCDIMKKLPFKEYEKQIGNKGYIGTMANDSSMRQANYLRTGCNVFNGNYIKSMPLSFWNYKNIWDYIKKFKLKYASIYDNGLKNTGCLFCMFGVHLEKGLNRFQLLEKSHPQLYSYCMGKLGIREVLKYIKVKYKQEAKQTKLLEGLK